MDYLLPFLWALNGTLAIIYLILEHLLTVGLLLALGWMQFALGALVNSYYAERMRALLLVTGISSLALSIISPAPAPFFMLAMPIFALTTAYLGLRRTNPADIFWSYAQSGLIYNGAVLLFLFLEDSIGQASGASGVFLLQGQNYIGLLGGIALYGIPVFYMATIAKDFLAHKPQPRPEDLLTTIRDARKPGMRP